MPRRNKREQHEPLDLTPAELPPTLPPGRNLTYSEARAQREARERERVERQREARINGGIDWSLCLVPGCGEQLRHTQPAPRRDHTVRLPMCYTHAFVVYQQAVTFHTDPLAVATNAELVKSREVKEQTAHEAAKKARLASVDGHMYFIRLNGLIKVGWTRDLYDRVKSYGASAEVLAHYPATRHDETSLHRQLRPALAKGREWYTDGPVLNRFVSDAVTRHGEPTIQVFWTEPKQPIRLRARSR